MADYSRDDVNFQGFLRPYETPEKAREMFEKYVETAKADGATITVIADSAADKMIVSNNVGLADAVFLKGNAVAGANGATDAKLAEAFAREFAKALPTNVPVIRGPEGAKEEEGKEGK